MSVSEIKFVSFVIGAFLAMFFILIFVVEWEVR